MKAILDTHSLLWYLEGNPRLSAAARAFIDPLANELFVSIASLWEIAIKCSLGKLNLAKPFETMFPEQLQRNSIEILNIRIEHLNKLCTLPLHHRDPFDRLLTSQALVDGIPIISADPALDDYGVTRIW